MPMLESKVAEGGLSLDSNLLVIYSKDFLSVCVASSLELTI